MSSFAQWMEALGGGGGRFTLRFGRLGVEAECRTLDAGEVEECRRMGGDRGLRYALYLACDELREAGLKMQEQGKVATPFDITLRLPYADVTAAGAAILKQSGADRAQVTLTGENGEQALAAPEDGWLSEDAESAEGGGTDVFEGGASPQGEAEGGLWKVARYFADRLSAAAENL